MTHTLEEGLQTIHREAGGLFDVNVWTMKQILLQLLVDPGNPILHAMADGIRSTRRLATGTAGSDQCLTCETTFSRKVAPVRIVTLTAHVDEPSMTLLSFICGECADRPDLEERMLAVFRRSWPDMRTIDMTRFHDEGGRA